MGSIRQTNAGKVHTVQTCALRVYLNTNPDGYKIERSGQGTIIRSPGKFEGEPLYVPYLFAQGMEGGGDETGTLRDGTTWDAFKLSTEELEQCAEHFSGDTSEAHSVVVLYYRDNGAVDSDLSTLADFEKWQNDPSAQSHGNDASEDV